MSILSALLILEAQEIRVLEITTEPEDTGKVIYTLKITPGKTEDIDLLTFECVYHQEFPFEDSSGKKYTKIHEPESFVYKEKNVRLVEELDKDFNFRVPLDLKLLVPIYGDKTFNLNYPVTVSTIKIKATKGGKKLWEYKVKAQGKFVWNPKTKKLEESSEPLSIEEKKY
ncbi:MAG: hypothetical protein QXH80_01715 [Candidatus Nanoarchaeia archaeon]